MCCDFAHRKPLRQQYCKLHFHCYFQPSTMARKQYTHAQKLRIVADADERLAQGESLRSIARFYNIQGVQIRSWKKQEMQLALTKRTKKSLSCGAVGRLHQFEEEIMCWAIFQRDAGVPLAYRHVMVKAGEVCPEFKTLSHGQQYYTVRRLCQRNYFKIRRITHSSQTDPNENVLEALQWLEIVRPIVRAPGVGKNL